MTAIERETSGGASTPIVSSPEEWVWDGVIEQAPAATIIVRGDAHVVEFVNTSHMRLFGSASWLGRPLHEIASEAAAAMCPALDEVARTGAIVNIEDVQAPAEEAGLAGRFLRFVCAPIRISDGDAIICQGFDITDSQNSQRRQAALASLGEKISELEDPDELAFAAAEILGRTLRVGRAGYGTIDLANETIHIERDWTMPGIPSLAGTLRFRDYGSYIDDLKLGRTVVFDDARVDPRTIANADALCAIQARSVVNMPVTEQGGFVALLYLNDAEARHWTQEELALVREVAALTRTAVERRKAEAAVRRNEARLGFLDALGKATAASTRAEDIMAETTRALGQYLASLFAPTLIWTRTKTASPFGATGARRTRRASSVTTALQTLVGSPSPI